MRPNAYLLIARRRQTFPGDPDHHDKTSSRAACHDDPYGDAIRIRPVARANRTAGDCAGQGGAWSRRKAKAERSPEGSAWAARTTRSCAAVRSSCCGSSAPHSAACCSTAAPADAAACGCTSSAPCAACGAAAACHTAGTTRSSAAASHAAGSARGCACPSHAARCCAGACRAEAPGSAECRACGAPSGDATSGEKYADTA
jgi:hypothetical protein